MSGVPQAVKAVLPWALPVALVVTAPVVLGDFDLTIVTSALVFGLFGASTDVLSGYARLPSFGQAAPFGVGAYAAALTAIHLDANIFVQMLVAIAAAMAVGVVVILVALRSTGTYFLMLTFAIAELLRARASTWNSVTGGLDGLAGVPAPSIGFGIELGSSVDIYICVACVVGAGFLLLWAISRAPFGLALRGMGEDEARMRAIGYHTARLKLTGFVIVAALAGLAGSLQANTQLFVSPEDLAISTSALALIVVVLGGQRTLWGAFLGAGLVIFVRDRGPELTGLSGPLLLGLLFVAVIYLLPNGIVGIRPPHRLRALATRPATTDRGEK